MALSGRGSRGGLRVFCVAGDGNRTDADYHPFYLGLIRVLPSGLRSQIDFHLHYSDHHGLFEESPWRSWPSVPPGSAKPTQTRAAPFQRCPCCLPNAASYDWYTTVTRRFRGDDDLLQLVSSMSLPDVRRYLTNPTLRDRLASRIASALREFQPDVVIAHSLGSILAVEALALNASADVPLSGAFRPPGLLLTAGAPFAFRRFIEAWSRRALSWVGEAGLDWMNLVDLTDEVVGGMLPPLPLYSAMRNVVVNNEHIANRLHPRRGFSSREAGLTTTHRIQHYLNHPPVVEGLASIADSRGESSPPRSGAELPPR